MSVLERVLGGVRGVLLTQERIDALRSDVKDLTLELRDHERRLTRLEAFAEMGLRRSGPPRLTDE